MISFPNSKINLGLRVLSRRDDGYHDIETVFYPVGWTDVLEILPSEEGEFEFSSSGIPLDVNAESNLCVKAYRLAEECCCIAPVKMHLHKCVPPGSGLGAGSSDAAFTLSMLNELYELGHSRKFVESIALKLGSDCPFFLRRKPLVAKGRGNCFEDISLQLAGMHILIVVPPLHVSTAEAYSWVSPLTFDVPPLNEVLSRPVSEWKNELINDFELPVFSRHPELGALKEKIYNLGAIYASMSGSGSSLYGIFENEPVLNGEFEACKTWKGILG